MSSRTSSDPSSGYTRSRTYGTTTYSTLSTSDRPLSPSTRYTYSPYSSRSASDDDIGSEGHMRRITVSPTTSPRTSTFNTYDYSDEDSISDAAEVEAALAMIDNELANTEDAVTEWSSRESNVSGPTSYSGRTGYTSRTGYTGTTGYSGETGYSEQTGLTGQTGFTGRTGYTGPTYSTHSPSNSEVGSYSSYSGSGTGSQARSYTTGSYGGGSFLSSDVFSPRSGPAEPLRLSTITERTENPSRPTSFQPSAGNRNSGLTADNNRRSTHSSHFRAATDPTERVASPVNVPKRTGQLIAFFEEKTNDKPSQHARSTSVPSGPRSPSPFASAYGYNPHPTRSTSPTKPRPTTNASRFPAGDYTDYTPSTYTQTQTGVTGTYTAARTQGSYTSTTSSDSYSGGSGNFSGLTDSYNTSSTATPTSGLRPPAATRSPLSTVRNTINAWKESKPAKRDEKPAENGDGLFSIRRRAERGSIRLRDHALRGSRGAHSEPVERELPATPKTGTGTTSGFLPPPFDVSDLGSYANAGGNQEPLRIGLLWYLNVHAPPPYRWQRCQAVLYPHMLLLSWIAPGGGRGIVTLDLLNCTEVRSVPSPTHPTARDDIGTIAAQAQANDQDDPDLDHLGDMNLVEALCPFQLLYSDGVERLGAESARERVRWVSAIWEALDHSVTIPDRSTSGSPTGSIRTIGSITSTQSSGISTGTGSASTTFVPPLDTIPDLSDFQSTSGSSLSRTPSLISSHHTRATDDNAISNSSYLYPGDPRVIVPSRSSSLRRTSSMTDLDEEFQTAVRRARDAKPGLGFGLSLVGALTGDVSPVTISSGSRLSEDVRITPPPIHHRDRSRTRSSEISTSSDPFRSASSNSQSRASSPYSLSTFSPRTKTGTWTGTGTFTGTGTTTETDSTARPTNTYLNVTSGDETEVVHSSLSYRGSPSTSLLGDSYDTIDNSDSTSTRSYLSRTREVVRRRRLSSRYSSHPTEGPSDKENSESCRDGSQDSYSGCTGTGISTLESYSYTTSRTPTRSYSSYEPSIVSRDPDDDHSDSRSDVRTESALSYEKGYEQYYEPSEGEKTPSTASFVSLPNIPSELSFHSAEGTPTEFRTARSPSEVHSAFTTAEVCTTETSTDFETCEVCRSDASTDYGTAECRCGQRARTIVEEESEVEESEVEESEVEESEVEESKVEESEVEVSISPPSEIEEPEPVMIEPEPEPVEVESVISPPSEIPTISDEANPEDIPLPSSRSPASTLSSLGGGLRDLISPPTTVESTSISPVMSESTSSMQISAPSEPSATSLSISSPTESSVTPTEISPPSPLPEHAPTPVITISSEPPEPSPVDRAVSLHPSQWAEETDLSFESSFLAPSSTISRGVPEGPDISFETSFMRPSVSQPSASLLTSPTPLSDVLTPRTSPRSLSLPSETPSSPSSPTTSITPTPTNLSSPTSGATPTTQAATPSPPSTIESETVSVSITEGAPVSLARTPSTISTVSTVSISSSIFETESAIGEYRGEEEPTEPSLLSTGRSLTVPRSLTPRPISPRDVTLPSSPEPSVSMSVSIATPDSQIPSIHSQLATIVSEPPREILTHDVNKLLSYLHDTNVARDAQHEELTDHLRAIEDELLDLSDMLRRREAEVHVHIPERHPEVRPQIVPRVLEDVPPPVPMKDRSVGSSRSVSPPPRPSGPRLIEMDHPSPIPSPVSSPGQSWLSSHHSDDDLYSFIGTEQYADREQMEVEPEQSPISSFKSESSPSDSSTSLDDESSYVSSSLSSYLGPPTPQDVPSVPSIPVSEESAGSSLSKTSEGSLSPLSMGVRPLPSPTPSVASEGTVRGPDIPLANLRSLLEGLRRQADALQRGQASTNELINELKERIREPSLGKIEDMLQELLDRAAVPPTVLPPPPPPPPPTEPETETSTSELSSGVLRERVEAILQRHREPLPPIHQPTPVRIGRPEDLFPDFQTASIPPIAPVPPPPLVPFVYHPAPRPPRSTSPRADIPARSMSVPIPQPDRTIYGRRRRPGFRRAGIPKPPTSTAPTAPDFHEFPDESRTQPTTVVDTPGPNFLTGVHTGRKSRHPAGDGYWSRQTSEAGDRPATAPPPGEEPESWYYRRRKQPEPEVPVPPPGTVTGVPMQPAQPAPPPTFLLPSDNTASESLLLDILGVMRDNRSFQMASVEQQNLLIDHLNRLNQWLTGDQQDRQNEMMGVYARVDQLREDLNRLYRDGPSQQPVFPVPQVVIPPPGAVEPPPSTIPEQHIPMPVSYVGYPEGFVPGSQMTPGQMPHYRPVVPEGVVPSGSTESTLDGTPVIPPRPPHWVTGETGIGVVPPTPEHPPHHQPPFVHRPRPSSESDEGPPVMPDVPPAGVPPITAPAHAGAIIIPPPGVTRPVSASRESSSSSSSGSTSTEHVTPSDIHQVPYRYGSPRSRPSSPSSGSTISSRPPPQTHTTVVNVGQQPPATMMPPEGILGPPGPPINIVAPSTPSVRREHALTQPQLQPIIIQPPAWPPQQLQQPPLVTTLVDPERRRGRRRRYRTSSSSSSSSPSSRTSSRSRSRERRRRRRSYSPSRTPRARSYTPSTRRRSRSRSYSPSRRDSRYYSPSRRSSSRTAAIPPPGVTVLPVPTVPSQYQPPSSSSTSSSSQVSQPAGQIFIQPALPPGMIPPGTLQPGVQPGGIVVQPGIPQPAGYVPPTYLPHQPSYIPTGPTTYVPPAQSGRTYLSRSRSRSPSRRLRRSRRSSRSPSSRSPSSRGGEPTVLVVPPSGVPTSAVPGYLPRSRSRSGSRSPSRRRRTRRPRRRSPSLSYSSDPSDYSRPSRRRGPHRHRPSEPRTSSLEESDSRRRRVLRRPHGPEEIEEDYGPPPVGPVTASPSRIPYPSSRREYSPGRTHRPSSPARTRSPSRAYTRRSPAHTHHTRRSLSYSPRTRSSVSPRSRHVLRRPYPERTISRTPTPTRRVSRSPIRRIHGRSPTGTRRGASRSPARTRRGASRSPTRTRRGASRSPTRTRRGASRSPTRTRRGTSRSPTSTRRGSPTRTRRGSPTRTRRGSPARTRRGASQSPARTRRDGSPTPTRRIRHRTSTRRSRSPSRSPSRYGRGRSRSITPTEERSVSLTPPRTHRGSRSPPSRVGRYRRRTVRRSRSYTPTQSYSVSPSRSRSPRRPPPTQPTTRVLIGPGPPGTTPTYLPYDSRRSDVVTIPRSVEEQPTPLMKTGPHIQVPSEGDETTHLRRSASITPEDSVIVSEPGLSRSPSPRRVPPPGRARSRARSRSGPRSQELTFADGERERQDRFRDLEEHMGELAEASTEAEDRRERIFRENEESRQRLFDDAELTRAEEAAHRRNQIWADLEDRLRALPPVTVAVPPSDLGSFESVHVAESAIAHTPPISPTVPVTPVVPGSPAPLPVVEPAAGPEPVLIPEDAASIVQSMRTAAARHAEEIREIVELEREQMANERAELAAEREGMMEEFRQERARLDEERQAKITELETELAQVKADLEAERALRVSEEADRRERERLEDTERHEGVHAQLSDITNLVQEQRDECTRKKELMDERWNEKMNRRVEKDAQVGNLYDMVTRIIEDREAERIRREEERIAAESRPGIERVLEELARQNAEQREWMDQMAESWRNDSARNREDTLAAIRETANEQVPYNVQGYLDEFSKSLANEVRMLLNEVGKLREEKRNIQFELGTLLTLRAKYRPGGEFDPDWKPDPAHYGGPWPPGGGPPGPPGPPEDQPPPEAPPPAPESARPAWRTVQQRPRKKKAKEPPPPPPVPEPRPTVSSWAKWEPDTRYVPTPPTTEPQLVLPARGPPGLFGPRSPRDSLQQ